MRFSVLLLVWVGSLMMGCEDSKEGQNLDLEAVYFAHQVEGCFLLRSLGTDQLFVYNPHRCEKGFLPASTFKMVNAMIGLETGVAVDAQYHFPWDSVARSFEAWNQDHTLKTGFQTSCVPCYQHLARQIGVQQMQEGVRKLNFGKMDINDETLSTFWLRGKSVITPYEQLDFMTRFAQGELPIKPETEAILKDMMILAEDENGVVMRGKTGWAIVGDRNIGWLVGTIERADGEQFVFVNNIEAKVGSISEDAFMRSRKKIVGQALQQLGVI